MNFSKEQKARVKRKFRNTTELAIFLRDELKIPATQAKSLAWQLLDQSGEAEATAAETYLYLTENVA